MCTFSNFPYLFRFYYRYDLLRFICVHFLVFPIYFDFMVVTTRYLLFSFFFVFSRKSSYNKSSKQIKDLIMKTTQNIEIDNTNFEIEIEILNNEISNNEILNIIENQIIDIIENNESFDFINDSNNEFVIKLISISKIN